MSYLTKIALMLFFSSGLFAETKAQTKLAPYHDSIFHYSISLPEGSTVISHNHGIHTFNSVLGSISLSILNDASVHSLEDLRKHYMPNVFARTLQTGYTSDDRGYWTYERFRYIGEGSIQRIAYQLAFYYFQNSSIICMVGTLPNDHLDKDLLEQYMKIGATFKFD